MDKPEYEIIELIDPWPLPGECDSIPVIEMDIEEFRKMYPARGKSIEHD